MHSNCNVINKMKTWNVCNQIKLLQGLGKWYCIGLGKASVRKGSPKLQILSMCSSFYLFECIVPITQKHTCRKRHRHKGIKIENGRP